jgi:hypothetical protein
LASLVRRRTGLIVRKGPFAGMRYIEEASAGAYLPKLLGIYEREVAFCIEEACQFKPLLIVDIGAAEGYYAVGLALRNPQAQVVAFEMEERGRKMLARMVEINKVSERVLISGMCQRDNLPPVFDLGAPVLVVCDAEGREEDLLDPTRIQTLTEAWILVETHDFLRPGVKDLLRDRFAKTHQIQEVWQESRTVTEFPYATFLTRALPNRYLERVVDEGRPARMCWLWMRSRKHAVKGNDANEFHASPE